MTAVWLPDGPPAATLADVRGRLAAGQPPGDLRGLPERVRHAVRLARQVGAPVLPALDAAVAALDDDRRRERALRVATAQARVVAGGLLVLPVLLVPGLGRLLDLDLIGFYATGGGRIVAVIAGILVLVAALLTTLLLRRAARPGGGLDEVVDLVATALAGGGSVGHALRTIADLGLGPVGELRRLALCHDLGRTPLDEAASDPLPPATRRRPSAAPRAGGELAPVAAVLASCTAWGAPAVPSLHALARDLRAEALADALAAAERLPAQLTFPTALCLLPATVLLIGAPLLADGLAAAAGAT